MGSVKFIYFDGFTESVDELSTIVASRLGLRVIQVLRDVRLFKGAVADLLIETPEGWVLVGLRRRRPGWDAIAQLQFLVSQAGIFDGPAKNADIIPVLVAPSFPASLRTLKHQVNLIEVPLELIPGGEKGIVALTKPKAWQIILIVLRKRHVPGIKSLAKSAGASTGWTSNVLSELRGCGIIQGKDWSDKGRERLFDLIATERPWSGMEQRRIPTGIDDWQELIDTLKTQWSGRFPQVERPRFWLCGLSAANTYSDHLLRHDYLHLYTRDPGGIQKILGEPNDGISILAYKPDRQISAPSRIENLPMTTLGQTILDVAGMGFKERDTLATLVEALEEDADRGNL